MKVVAVFLDAGVADPCAEDEDRNVVLDDPQFGHRPGWEWLEVGPLKDGSYLHIYSDAIKLVRGGDYEYLWEAE